MNLLSSRRFFVNEVRTRYGPIFRHNWLLLAIWPSITAVAILSIWRVELLRYDTERDKLEARTLHEVQILSNAYSEQLVRSVQKFDDITELVLYRWEASSRTFRLEAFAGRSFLASAHFVSLNIIDADGNTVTSTPANNSHLNFTDRPYFQAHKADPSNELRISSPTIGRISNRKVIFVTRRITNPDGSFGGVVVVAAASEFFTPESKDASFKISGLQVLIGNDGVQRVASIGGVETQPTSDAIRKTQACIPGDLPKLFEGSCFVDGQSRYMSASSMGIYPLKAVIGLSERDVLSPFYEEAKERKGFLFLILGVLGAAGIAAFTMTLFALIRRQEAEEVRFAYRQATDNAREGFYLLRKLENKDGSVKDFKFIDCNERGAELYGMTRAQLLEKTLFELYGDVPHFHGSVARFCRYYELGGGDEEFKIPAESLITSTWQRRKFHRTLNGLALTTADISDEIEHREELIKLATEDHLTGLPNRRWITENLPKILEDALRHESSVAILFLDLDDFKDVNDVHGHSTGDLLLEVAAARLRHAVRPGDIVSRLGGDEFIIVMPRISDVGHVEAVAQRVLDIGRMPFNIGHTSLSVSLSLGVSTFPEDGFDSETLLKNADIAMYASKVTKGTLTFYSAQLNEARRIRLAIERDIASAIKNDEFTLHFQPRFDPVNRVVVGMEALIRWLHPSRGMVMPNDFIPIAEASHLILQIGEIVVWKAARQILAWQALGLAVVPISVNASRRQFDDGGVQALIERVLSDTGLDSTLLEVEVTESTMMANKGNIGEQLVGLSKLGVKTHVDDFGTGYSSLSMLQEFSLDVLKIDRAFTQALGKTPESKVLFQAVVTMGHALGMSVVAEGVETQEQLDFCILAKCNEVQGYFFSKPVDADTAAGFLHTKSGYQISNPTQTN